MILKIYPENPNPKEINKVVETLRDGGVIIYPTDSVYGMGCDISNRKGIERIARIRGFKTEKVNFSMIFHSIQQISEYTKPINNSVFKLLKKNLPGPFTFILNANNKVPDIFKSNKKTIGVRIPDNNVLYEIVNEFGFPIITTSIHDDDDVIEYTSDPELIHEKYKQLVEIVVDGGYGQNVASTVVDCTGDEPEIVRQGIGELIW